MLCSSGTPNMGARDMPAGASLCAPLLNDAPPSSESPPSDNNAPEFVDNVAGDEGAADTDADDDDDDDDDDDATDSEELLLRFRFWITKFAVCARSVDHTASALRERHDMQSFT